MEQSGNLVPESVEMQKYGKLATQLNDSLSETRRILADHAGLLPEGRLRDLDDLLSEFAGRRIRIAFYGEVKAGKSTLVNAVAGQELSPSAFGPLTSVPVRVTWGSENAWHAGEHRFDNASALSEMMKADTENIGDVVIETSADLLRLGGQVDLIDTPGVGSRDRFDQISAEALRALDTVVLVVRYPALFTRFTRHIVNELQNDIGKLFVVWNLDASCAELSKEERERHAENLRTRVAGAHELHLVDAREGFRAARDGNPGGLRASGLSDFNAALAAFASSQKREISALREAAKRGTIWLDEAQKAMAKRESVLADSLKTTRGWLQDVKSRSDAEKEKIQAGFAAFQEETVAAENERKAAVDGFAGRLRGEISSARRSWIFSADAEQLESSARKAAEVYADDAAAACRAYVQAVQEAGKRFGAAVPTAPRSRVVPFAEPLVAEDRLSLATQGRMQLVKRMLFANWYLPGISELKGPGLSEDVAAQASWAREVADAAEKAVRAVMDGKLAEVDRRHREEADEIKSRTRFDAEESEMAAIREHKPMIEQARVRVVRIGEEARVLFG